MMCRIKGEEKCDKKCLQCVISLMTIWANLVCLTKICSSHLNCNLEKGVLKKTNVYHIHQHIHLLIENNLFIRVHSPAIFSAISPIHNCIYLFILYKMWLCGVPTCRPHFKAESEILCSWRTGYYFQVTYCVVCIVCIFCYY